MYTLLPLQAVTGKKAIADRPDIRAYIQGDHARERHRPARALPPPTAPRRLVGDVSLLPLTVERTDTGETVELTGSFLTSTSGYRNDEGFMPDWEGLEDLRGQLVHPQHWPEDLDYTGKRVVMTP